MGLVNLTTDLKNLKYGKDRKGGGSSGQPYVKTSIPDGLTSSSPDFLLRNGYLNPLNSLEDVSRLTKMFFDLKSPNGILFTAKQNVLSRSAVKTQTSGIINDSVYNPLSTLAQSGIISIGGHLNKQGINPFDSTGAYANNNNLYYTRMKNYNQEWLVSPDGNLKNRLFALYESKIQNNEIGGFAKTNNISSLPSEILSYNGGPGSNLGVGNTSIKFSDQRTGINNALATSPNYKSYFYGTAPKIIVIGDYLKTIYSSDINKGASGKYSRFTNVDVVQAYNQEGQPVGVYNFDVYEPNSLKNSPLVNVNNTFTYTQEDIVSTPDNVGKLNGSPKIQDFRAILREKLKGTQKETATTSGATPITPDYNIKNIENRNLLGDPGKKQGKNLSSYTNGSGIGPVDKINALPIYRSQWVSPNDDLKNDLVKFRIAAIDNDNPSFKTFMHFRAFIDSFSDSYSGDWASTKYLGRGENFYNYTGFNRTISLSWTVVAQSKEELIPMYKKLNYLASNLMPDYSNSGYMRGPLLQLTMGGYLYEQVGFFTSLTYEIPQESTWEIGIDDIGGEDSTVKELPHMIKVQAAFTPIHDFVPAKQTLIFDDQLLATVNDKDGKPVTVTKGFANGYGNERFIALSVGSGSNFNNYDTAKAYNVGGYSVV